MLENSGENRQDIIGYSVRQALPAMSRHICPFSLVGGQMCDFLTKEIRAGTVPNKFWLTCFIGLVSAQQTPLFPPGHLLILEAGQQF